MRTAPEQQLAWLRLSLEPGLRPAVARELWIRGGSAAAVYAWPRATLTAAVGATLATQMLAAPQPALAQAMAAAQAWAACEGHYLVTLEDDAYPPTLRQIYDPPPVLYVAGELAALARPAIAIVGARHATPGGLELAREFACALAARGWCVVSGLALGIDAAAHEGALAAGSAGSGTVAVLGTGADVMYPQRNRELAGRIRQSGAVISEVPLGTPPSRFQFPRRNRLVAGLVRGVLVVEAAMRSGSLITARLAGELGREVFAIPGSIHSPLSRGCHALIRQGAKLTEEVEDILAELPPSSDMPPPAPVDPAGSHATTNLAAAPGAFALQAGSRAPADIAPAKATVQRRRSPSPQEQYTLEAIPPADAPALEARILAALGYDVLSVDELVQRTHLGSDVLLGALLVLELGGRIARLEGGRFQRLRNRPPARTGGAV